MLRQTLRIAGKNLLRRNSQLNKLSVRSFSQNTLSTSQLPESNNNSKWIFAALGSFGVGYAVHHYYGNKKLEPIPAITNSEIPKQEVTQPPLQPEKTEQNIQEYNGDLNTLVAQLAACKEETEVEKLLYGKDNNILIKNISDLRNVLNAIYLNSRWEVKTQIYFLDFFAESVKKFVIDYDSLKTVIDLDHNYFPMHTLLQLIPNLTSLVDNYQKFYGLCQTRKVVEILRDSLPKEHVVKFVLESPGSNVAHLRGLWDKGYPIFMLIPLLTDNQLTTFMNEDKGLMMGLMYLASPSTLAYLGSKQLRIIFNSYDKINELFVHNDSFNKSMFRNGNRLQILNLLGVEHVYQFTKDIPPLQKKQLFQILPQEFADKVEAMGNRTNRPRV